MSKCQHGDPWDNFTMSWDELKRQERVKAKHEKGLAEKELKEKTEKVMEKVDWKEVPEC